MNYREFGSTGLRVSDIGFGCARIGGVFAAGKLGLGDTIHLLRKAADSGINFFDTADMYAQGESESLLGRAFRQHRESVIISTKGGYCLPSQRKLIARIKPLIKPIVKALGIKRESLPQSVSGSLSQDFSPGYIVRAAEASLKRLGSDVIDLYQLHSPPARLIGQAAFQDSLGALEKLKSDGKIRHFGVACDTAADAIMCLPFPSVSSLQFPFGLLDQEALTNLIPAAKEKGIALIARGCFGGGLLKETLREAELKDRTEKWGRILAYRRVADRQGRHILEAALQVSLHPPGISTTLLGMHTMKHLENNLLFHSAPALTDNEFGEYTRE
jgi:aryl-alcohol dehydrogenase-like predicted oxidoreductase